MNKPNFFLIGASKSGTTSLYHYLKQHPDIFMCSEKEPSFFLFPNGTPPLVFPDGLMSTLFRYSVKNVPRVFPTFNEYVDLFKDASKQKIIGEASPDYLVYPDAPKAIFEFDSNAKLVVILRNPFDAAYSEFLMNERDGEFVKGTTFMDVLKVEYYTDSNLQNLPKLIRSRLYDIHIKRYLDFFKRDQMHFFLFEDLKDTDQLLKILFEFLGISVECNIDVSKKYNNASTQKTNPRLELLLRRIPVSVKDKIIRAMPSFLSSWYLSRRFGIHEGEKQTVKCPEEAKEYLRPIFTPAIKELENVIGRDLSTWLN